jgi:hypothetical protein
MYRFKGNARGGSISPRELVRLVAIFGTAALLGCGKSSDVEKGTTSPVAGSAALSADSESRKPPQALAPKPAQEGATAEPKPGKSIAKPAAEKDKSETTEPAVTVNDLPREPATAEEAARQLDLRAFPVLPGAEITGRATLADITYQAKSDTQAAFEFQRKHLKEKSWQELPGSRTEGNNPMAHFTREGFLVAVSVSEITGQADRAGWVHVSVHNHGNVDVAKLPPPNNAKPLYSFPGNVSYITDAKVSETAEACRKRFLELGWSPYGFSGQEDFRSLYFKRNAIKLDVSVSTAPAQGGKTVVSYSTEQLSADLPAPPEVTNPQYADFIKQLNFDVPKPPGDVDGLAAFYQKELATQGFKSTTEKAVTSDREAFLVFRNPQRDMINLDMTVYRDLIRVKVKHYTAAEVDELEREIKKKTDRLKKEKEGKGEKN